MPVRGPLISRALRLQIGASVLSAARLVDTRLVKARLARFEREHRLYVETDRKVTAMARKIQAARANLSRCDRVLAEAVEALACALIADGHRRRNPFAGFKVPSPSVLVRLPFAGEARVVHRLVAAVQQKTPVGPGTAEAARAADEAARAVEEAIVAVAKVEPEVRVARRTTARSGTLPLGAATAHPDPSARHAARLSRSRVSGEQLCPGGKRPEDHTSDDPCDVHLPLLSSRSLSPGDVRHPPHPLARSIPGPESAVS